MARASRGDVCHPAVHPSRWVRASRVWSPMLLVVAALAAASCTAPQTPSRPSTGGFASAPLVAAPGVAGDPNAGRMLFATKGCPACHTAQHALTATGVVGPNLTNVALRPTLGGDRIENTPENLARWIMDPSAMKAGSPMPNMGLNQQEARDIAAFLYSHPHNPVR